MRETKVLGQMDLIWYFTKFVGIPFKMIWLLFKNKLYVIGILPKEISTIFLTLITMVKNAQEVSDFRPICLVSSLYRIVEKVTTSRFIRVIYSLISRNQFAFVQNR